MNKFNTIEEAIEDFKKGKIVIVLDDEDRENEGDFVASAEKITPEIINFMIKKGRGLVCTPLAKSEAVRLELVLMHKLNEDIESTSFTVSIDSNKVGSGISAFDRSQTIKDMVNLNMTAEDFSKPGHIFPLIARDGGVLERAGHTEAAVDLAIFSGLRPISVICEILSDDGNMARGPELFELAKKFDLKLIRIEDLIKYRASLNMD